MSEVETSQQLKNKVIYRYVKRNRTYTLVALFSIILISTSISIFLFPSVVSNFFPIPINISRIISGGIFIIGIGMLSITYLNFTPLRYDSIRLYEYENMSINDIFSYHLKEELIDKHRQPNLYKLSSLSEIKNKRETFFTEDLKVLKNKFIEQYNHNLEFYSLFDDLYKLETKFKSRISTLIKNSKLNLIIGISTTVLALLILLYSTFQNSKFTTSIEFLSFFIPKISTVIFVEIFSFFFLNLYKNNLDEIKYFQNEITNLNFKIVSLKTGIRFQNNDAIDKIIAIFSTTERNSILKKDESTEKLEIQKIENNENSKYCKSIIELINTIKK